MGKIKSWRRTAFRRRSKKAGKMERVGDSSDSDDEVEGAREEDEEDEEAETIMMGEGDGNYGNNLLIKKGSFLGMTSVPAVETVREAVLTNDCDRLKELLEEGAPIDDGLLHAVSSGFQPTVQTICDFLATKGVEECCETVNRFAVGTEFLASTTALQIASKENNYDIVKTLLHYGAELPELKTCLLTPGVKDDRLIQCFAFLQYMKAMASPSLLLLTEVNPVGRALRIAVDLSEYRLTGKKITRTLQSHPSFTEQIDSVVATTEDLACCLLDQCKSKREIEVFLKIPATLKKIPRLRKQPAEEHQKEYASDLPVGLENAKMLKFKKVVAHPFSQMVVTDRIFRGPVDWEEMSSMKFFLLSMMVVIGSPILCLGYSVFPVKKLVQFMATPYVRVLTNVSSSLLFLLALLLTALNVKYSSVDCPEIVSDYTENANYCSLVTPMFWPIYGRMVIIFAMTLGQIMWLISSVYRIGLWTIFHESFSWFLLTQILLFMTSFAMYLLSLLKVSSYIVETDAGLLVLVNRQPSNITLYFDIDGLLYQPSRATWDPLDPQVLAEVTFALANILTAQRLLYTFIFFKSVGPLVISISQMLYSLYRFAAVTFVILVSFTLGFAQLFAPYSDLHVCAGNESNEDDHCGNAEMFSSIRMSFHTLFWAIVGEFKISDMDLPTKLFFVELTGQILHGIFITMTTIILLNMLIAAMLTAYEIIQGDVHTEWKFARTKMLEVFCGNRPNIPPPYNLIPSVRIIWSGIKKLAAAFVRGLIKLGVKVPEQYKERSENKWKRQIPQQDEDRQMKKERMLKERGQVLQTLVARYKYEHCEIAPTNRPSSHSASRGPASPLSPGVFQGVPAGGFPLVHQEASSNEPKDPTIPMGVIAKDISLEHTETTTTTNGDPVRRKPASISLV